jgi:hypothetical protein
MLSLFEGKSCNRTQGAQGQDGFRIFHVERHVCASFVSFPTKAGTPHELAAWGEYQHHLQLRQ